MMTTESKVIDKLVARKLAEKTIGKGFDPIEIVSAISIEDLHAIVRGAGYYKEEENELAKWTAQLGGAALFMIAKKEG